MKSFQSKNHTKNPYYYKLLLTILFTSLIPSTLITFIYTKNSLDMIKEKAIESNLLHLQLISNSLEIVKDNILDFSNLLSINDIFTDYVRISDKKYFEEFTKIPFNYTDQDFKRLYEYLSIRGEIYDTLETITLSNQFIESIYFYDPSRDMVFKNGSLPVSFPAFPDQEWKKVLARGVLLPYIMSLRVIDREDNQKKNIISFVFENIEEGIPFVINVDAEVLYQQIVASVGWDPDDVFFILSQDGTPLLYSMEDHDLIRRISILAESFTSHTNSLSLGEANWIITNLVMDDLGWTAYSVTDANKARKELRLQRIKIFLLSMFFFPLAFYLVIFLGKKLYKPIEMLSGYARSLDEEPAGQEGEDLGLIWNRLKSFELREKKLEEKIKESLPAYRLDFLKRLLMEHPYGIEEIMERLKYIQSPLQMEHLTVIVFLAEVSNQANPSLPDQLLLRVAIEQAVKDSFLSHYPGEYIYLSTSEHCIIFNLTHHESVLLEDIIDVLIRALKDNLSMIVTLGISSPARSILDIPKSYTEALNALHTRNLAGKGHAIFYEDLHIGEYEDTYYDAGTKASMIREYVRQGNGEAAEDLLSIIHGDLIELKEKISFRKATQVYINLLNEVLNGLYSTGIDFDCVRESEDPFIYILKLTSIDEIHSWLLSMIQQTARTIQETSQKRKNKKIEDIIHYVEKECGQDINLNIIADKIGLNPSYVSRLFKESMNQSFIEYLTDVRMNRAMDLLKTTEMTIGKIGHSVGYINSNYFIRIFKKKTGKTPREYRQLFIAQKKAT